jgi:hypothetical protein
MVIYYNIVTNKMYFLSSFGCFPGVLFYIYAGFTAVNLDDFIDSSNKNSNFD